MLFKSKSKEFDPRRQLQIAKKKYLFQGKVVKEEECLQWKFYPDSDYWYNISETDVVKELTEKDMRDMGLEFPGE